MEKMTVSPKFQVVIPKAIREKLRLSPGQKVQAIVYGDRIELIPMRSIKEKLHRLSRSRLARECAKVDPGFEKAMAEEGMSEELGRWPEY